LARRVLLIVEEAAMIRRLVPAFIGLAIAACDSRALEVTSYMGEDRAPDLAFQGDACSKWNDDATRCQQHSCTPVYGGCEGMAVQLIGCYEPGDPEPQPSCPPTACSDHTVQATCNADPSCYSLFEGSVVGCLDPASCPATFMACNDGPAICVPDANLVCEDPESCAPGFVPVYAPGLCSLGCVEGDVCMGA
jgi:hypothetical protein